MKAIKTTYRGPTDANGSRITASDGDGNSITVGYRHDLRDGAEVHSVAALALCRKLGWDGTLIAGALRDGYVFVFIEGSDTYPVSLTDEELATRNKRIDAILARN